MHAYVIPHFARGGKYLLSLILILSFYSAPGEREGGRAFFSRRNPGIKTATAAAAAFLPLLIKKTNCVQRFGTKINSKKNSKWTA